MLAILIVKNNYISHAREDIINHFAASKYLSALPFSKNLHPFKHEPPIDDNKFSDKFSVPSIFNCPKDQDCINCNSVFTVVLVLKRFTMSNL